MEGCFGRKYAVSVFCCLFISNKSISKLTKSVKKIMSGEDEEV